jgi:saccharopine dehydrogenase-like NADP-dependent oxidoreductase
VKILVLGSGLVGGPAAIDLTRDKNFKVTVADLKPEALKKLKEFTSIQTLQADLSRSEAIKAIITDFDLVLNALPGFLGFSALKTVIQAKKNVVDMAFFPEDPFLLDTMAKDNGVTAIVDCGVAPGLSNLLVGKVYHELDQTDSVLIYVGGLPEEREWPYEYKAVFSPIDVLEEYIRPARLVENGQLVTRPALTEPELLRFQGIGTLEAFNSDGLRTLITTIKAENMKEKTMRYPGHLEKIRLLKKSGFFSKEEVDVKGIKLRPIDFTATILFPRWEMKNRDRDLTVMKVIIEGLKNKTRYRYTYDLLDRYHEATKTHSMARTTGYTATVTLRLLAQGLYSQPGISPLEFLGQDQNCIDYIMKGLNKREIYVKENMEEMGS